MKTTNTQKAVARILTMALAICLMACLLPTNAKAVNTAVTDVRNGVLQVNLVYNTNTGEQLVVSTGTGFLVNPTTLVTCDHCVTLDQESMEYLAAMMGTDAAAVKRSLSCTVTVSRDVTISASVKHSSYEMDFAILTLSQPLQKATPLKLRNAQKDPIEQTETVYAVGFPALPALQQNYSTFTSSDATITSGVVNKVSSGTNPYSGVSTDYIMTSCDLDHGNSGGPMVDENGYVIGVCQSVITSDASGLSPEFYYAVDINQVIEVMDQTGIKFDFGGENNDPDPTEPAEKPTQKDPVEDPTPAQKETMPKVEDDEKEENKDDGKEEDNNLMLILIIAGAAVVVVIVVVVIVLVAGGKKKTVAPANVPPVPPVNPVVPSHIPGGFTPAAPQVPHSYNNNGYTAPVAPAAGETTILNQGAGETTVLSKNVNGGSLIRKRTGESISISSEQFVIGRERKSVNYCISDNTSISRSHVRLTVRNGVTYLADLNAANGTYVNGVKAAPRQEIALKSGDKITLADEDFEYRM